MLIYCPNSFLPLPWSKCIFPHIDGSCVIDGKGQFRQCHVQLVHGGQVFARLAVAFGSRSGKFVDDLAEGFFALVLLVAHHLL